MDHRVVEERMAAMTDVELIDAVENHPGDYEPFALEIAKAELARREIVPIEAERLRAEAAAITAAEPPPTVAEALRVHYGFVFRLTAGMVAWPLVFAAGHVARKEGRHRDARAWRIAGWFGVAAWLVLGLALYAKIVLNFE